MTDDIRQHYYRAALQTQLQQWLEKWASSQVAADAYAAQGLPEQAAHFQAAAAEAERFVAWYEGQLQTND